MKHRQGGLAANFFDMKRLGIRAVLNRCAGVKSRPGTAILGRGAYDAAILVKRNLKFRRPAKHWMGFRDCAISAELEQNRDCAA
jgi:hypothetical protein